MSSTFSLIKLNHVFCFFSCGECLCAPFTLIIWRLKFNGESDRVNLTRIVLHGVNLVVNVCDVDVYLVEMMYANLD